MDKKTTLFGFIKADCEKHAENIRKWIAIKEKQDKKKGGKRHAR